MKKVLIALLAGVLAHAAIVSEGVTRPAYIRGMEQRGHAVWEEPFKGMEWRCGEETCWAGMHVHPLAWGTGT